MTNETNPAPAALASFTLDRAPLAAALAYLAGEIVERRNTIPILSCVRIRADGELILVEGTDLDILARITVPGAINAPGAIVADAAGLAAAVKACAGDSVTVAETAAPITHADGNTDGRATISDGAYSGSLATKVASDFPAITPAESPTTLTVEAAQLASDLGRARCAMSTEGTRYYLNGVYVHAPEIGDGGRALRFAATDGHRLVRIERPLPVMAGPQLGGCIIPRKVVACILKAIGSKPAGEVALSLGKAKGGFATTLDGGNPISLTFKLIDGTFPDYTRVIPSTPGHFARFEAKPFGEAVKGAAAASSGKMRGVRLDFGRDGCRAVCTSSEGTAAAVPFAVEVYTHLQIVGSGDNQPAFSVGFNAPYLADFVKIAAAGKKGAGRMSIDTVDAATPAVIRIPEQPEFLGVLMPMRVDGASKAEPVREAYGPPAPPPETPRNRFVRVYGKAWAARDGAVMREAVETFRAGLVEMYALPDVIGATLRREASEVRGEAKAAKRAKARLTLAMGGGRRAYGASFKRSAHNWNEADKRRRQVAAIVGYQAADTRDVLPIEDRDGKRRFVLRRELIAGTFGLTEVDAKGEPKRVGRRSYGRSIYLDHIARIVPVRAPRPAVVVPMPSNLPGNGSPEREDLFPVVEAMAGAIERLEARIAAQDEMLARLVAVLDSRALIGAVPSDTNGGALKLVGEVA